MTQVVMLMPISPHAGLTTVSLGFALGDNTVRENGNDSFNGLNGINLHFFCPVCFPFPEFP